MKKIMDFLSVLLFSGWAGSASASLLSPVSVNGLQWLQPVDFLNTSWNDINAVCNAAAGGLCTASLGGNDLSGWTWANIDDVDTLFNFFVGSSVLGPGPDSFHEDGATWAENIFAAGFIRTNNSDLLNAIWGGVRDQISLPRTTLASMQYYAPDGTYPNGWSFATTKGSTADRSAASGQWFYRQPSSAVSIPTTLLLLGLGLAALGVSRRKRSCTSKQPHASAFS